LIRWRDVVVDRSRRMIGHRGEFVRFAGRGAFRFVETLVLAEPRTRAELFEIVYRDAEDGGPLEGVKLIDLMLHNYRPRLARIGLCIRKEKSARGMLYWVEPI
jgi:hypothetical protein